MTFFEISLHGREPYSVPLVRPRGLGALPLSKLQFRSSLIWHFSDLEVNALLDMYPIKNKDDKQINFMCR